MRKTEIRSLFQKMFGSKKTPQAFKRFELVSGSNSAFYPWDGKIFENDIVRSAIRPKASAVGKLNLIHIRGTGNQMKINPDAQIKEILEQPNPYMSMQDFLMKLTFQREINHNAFAYVKRDDYNGKVLELYPIPYSGVELVEVQGELYLKFQFWTGKYMAVPYTDIIHLRKDFNNHDFFGEKGTKALKNIMEVINTTDQGVINTIKNSAVVKWIMMFKQTLRPEDKEIQVGEFIKNYLSIDKAGGVAVSDPRYELKQVDEKNYVPNALQMDKSIQRLYSYFGVNDAIVQNKYTEDQWNAFYESEIEPVAQQICFYMSRAFFTKKERGFGNRIASEASSLQYASMGTKLNLMQMVDRGAMTPNEWRLVMNMGPVEGGDVPVRRLDTAPVDETKTEPAEEQGDQGTVLPEGEGIDQLADVVSDDEAIAQISLNGAQIQSLLAIVQSVNDGVLDYNSAIELIVAAFPFDREKAEKILGPKKEPVKEVEPDEPNNTDPQAGGAGT